MFDNGERRRLVDHLRRTGIQMALVLGAKHFSKFRPGFKRRQSGMRCDETMTVPDECQEFLALFGVQINLAMTKKEDPLDVAQARPAARRHTIGFERGVGDDVRIGANERVPPTGLVAEPFDDRERVRSESVLGYAVSRVGPREQYLARRCGIASTAAAAAALRSGFALATGSRLLRSRRLRQEQRATDGHDQGRQ